MPRPQAIAPAAAASAAAVAAKPSAQGLAQPVESLALVGPTRAKHFHKLRVDTLGDLLEYFPRDYVYESAEKPIEALVPDQVQTVRGEITAIDYVPGRRPRFAATLSDGPQRLSLVFFNAAYVRWKLHPGMMIRVQGAVKMLRNIPEMVNPKWSIVDESTAPIEASRYRPIYPATAGLPSDVIAAIVHANLPAALEHVREWFDAELLRHRKLCQRQQAYRAIHEPADEREALGARRRIIYDELIVMQLGLGMSKRLRDGGKFTAPVLRVDKLLDERIRKRFPFQMTRGQEQAVWQILRDFQGGVPMNRLLQGDVGSGKTVVAVYAMLVAVANRMQSAILAPTEVLAEQHYLTLSNMLAGSSVRIALFTQRTKSKKKDRQQLARDLAEGAIHIAVGTQALLQEDVEFANLGLVVADEQHRLGVRQRASLKSKGPSPHYLVMTATPIPRTLALSYFADFDVTVIDEMPPGRQPINTRWLTQREAGRAYEFIKRQVAAGQQAYIVLPQIDDDGLGDSKSVTKELERLAKGPLAGLRLSALHGQLDTDEKQATMSAFRDRQIDVLVATTVIEVGIDVPNATVMLIDNADRFGLSQLHQLRGRVGRGDKPSYCILVSDAAGPATEARLSAMTETSSGFEIAELDLKLRGPGEFFGTRQHGLPEFKLADVTSEMDLLVQAKEDALALLDQDPKLTAARHSELRRVLMGEFGDSLGLAQVG
jgi:ATP-dependent DNA helicase RecG